MKKAKIACVGVSKRCANEEELQSWCGLFQHGPRKRLQHLARELRTDAVHLRCDLDTAVVLALTPVIAAAMVRLDNQITFRLNHSKRTLKSMKVSHGTD